MKEFKNVMIVNVTPVTFSSLSSACLCRLFSRFSLSRSTSLTTLERRTAPDATACGTDAVLDTPAGRAAPPVPATLFAVNYEGML